MKINYNTSTLHLEDMPLDIGYASEKVTLKNYSDETFTIGGQNGFTQLIITAAFIDDTLLTQMQEIDTLLSLNALCGITKALVTANTKDYIPSSNEWLIGIDTDEAFGDYYGIRLAPGELGGEFTKAIFVISKDGAIFYNEIPHSLDEPFNIDKIVVKIAAANNCYTGKGCHG